MTDPSLQPPRTVRIILAACAAEFGVSVADVTGMSRCACYVRPRQIAIYLARTVARQSLQQVGRMFGGRDHTTVLHAERKIAHRAMTDWAMALAVARCLARVDCIAATLGNLADLKAAHPIPAMTREPDDPPRPTAPDPAPPPPPPPIAPLFVFAPPRMGRGRILIRRPVPGARHDFGDPPPGRSALDAEARG